MGYYTDFKVENNCEDKNRTNKIYNRLNAISGYEFGWGKSYSNKCAELLEAKWYTSDADMKQLSSEYPDILFTVYGDGEDSGDLWVAYYKTGKGTDYLKPAIVYPLPMEDEFK